MDKEDSFDKTQLKALRKCIEDMATALSDQNVSRNFSDIVGRLLVRDWPPKKQRDLKEAFFKPGTCLADIGCGHGYALPGFLQEVGMAYCEKCKKKYKEA